MRMKPLPPRPELSARLKENAKQFAALPRIERDAHIADQAASFVRGETGKEPERPNYAKELIAAQQKIAGLEAAEAHLLNEQRRKSALIDSWVADSRQNLARAKAAEQALTAERQRRESERQAIADEARRYAGFYEPHSDGRNTFILLAEWIEANHPTASDSEERGG